MKLGLLLGIITAFWITTAVQAQEIPTPTATPVPTGSIIIVEEADCTTRRFEECQKFTYHSNSATIGDFTLHAVRDNENDDSRTFAGLNAGTYVISQTFAELPFQDVNCTNGQGRRNPPSVTRQGDRVAINLGANETVRCTWHNAPEPTPTPTPVPPTATPTATATPSPTATQQPVIIHVPVIQTIVVEPTATLTPAVSIRPPATGSGGLVK